MRAGASSVEHCCMTRFNMLSGPFGDINAV